MQKNKKATRAEMRDLVRDALKDAGLDDLAEQKNKDIDTMIAAVGDAVGEILRHKAVAPILMHDHAGKVTEALSVKLKWKAGRKGYRKGQKYERKPTPISPDPNDWEDEVELEDGTVIFVGKRQESKPDTPPRWGLTASPKRALVEEVLPDAPKRKPN